MASIAGSNHWWHIADAIRTAETDQRPLGAVGGGWSFSDASLPGSVSTARPNVRLIEPAA